MHALIKATKQTKTAHVKEANARKVGEHRGQGQHGAGIQPHNQLPLLSWVWVQLCLSHPLGNPPLPLAHAPSPTLTGGGQ